MNKRHQLPIIELEGLNIEEKETRHDLDKKINRDMNAKNRSPEKCENIPE